VSRVHWERLDPEKACSSPDGHCPVDVMTMASEVPVSVFCQRCGSAYTVIALPGERTP